MMTRKGIEFLIYWGRRLTRKKYLYTGGLRSYQIKSANQIFLHARAASAFYADLYRRYGVPENFVLKTLADISKLPVVKKEDFKKASLENLLLCENFDKKKLWREVTTGSTGIPSEIFFTKDSHKKTRDVEDRIFHNLGVRKYHRYCYIWRSKSLSDRNLKRRESGLYLFLNVGDVANPLDSALTRENLASSVRSLVGFNPQIIHGYVSALFAIARHIEKNNLRFPELKRVIAAAEYLPLTVWNTLESAFKCPVINFYGASEAGAIACSGTDSRRMYISEDLYFVEVLDENDKPVTPGNPGLITLTNLTAKAMPFIRFQIGDMAVVDEGFYDYGEKFRHFVCVEGRTNDVFELEDGSVIFSHLWHILFRDQLWIERFRVTQKTRSRIEVVIVPSPGSEQKLSSFSKMIRERFKGIEFDFQIADEIELGAGDKFRAIISEVPNKFNRINKGE